MCKVFACTTELVALAGRHPLLSSMYRLLRVVMGLADSAGIFTEAGDAQVSHGHAILLIARLSRVTYYVTVRKASRRVWRLTRRMSTCTGS